LEKQQRQERYMNEGQADFMDLYKNEIKTICDRKRMTIDNTITDSTVIDFCTKQRTSLA